MTKGPRFSWLWLTTGAFALLGLGFLVGVVLRASLVEDTSWCRDYDYGNVPQWLALVVGAVVAVYTVRGIRTARRTYADDVRVREYAQARLVYAELSQAEALNKHDYREVRVVTPEPKIVVIPRVEADGEEQITCSAERGRLDGPVVVDPIESIRLYNFTVNNVSDELISHVRVTLDELETGWVTPKRLAASQIAPKTTAEWVVTAPATGHTPNPTLTVEFRDATGRWWKRQGSMPVERVDDHRRDGYWPRLKNELLDARDALARVGLALSGAKNL